MANYSGPYLRQVTLLDRIADAITGKDDLDNPTGVRSLDALERLAIWFEEHGGIPSGGGDAPIYYHTEAEWDAQATLIAAAGAIYIYSDHKTVTDPTSGEVTLIPGIKIGDGTSFLKTLPFVTDATATEAVVIVNEHVADSDVHVSDEDRATWNKKVEATVDPDNPEVLVIF